MCVVRLTYCVTPSFYNFRNGRQKKANKPGLSVKICCNKGQNNKYSNFYIDPVILLSVLPFSDGLNLLKQYGVSVMFVLSTVPERMSTISLSKKLDMSIKGSTVNQKTFFYFIRTPKTLIHKTLITPTGATS